MKIPDDRFLPQGEMLGQLASDDRSGSKFRTLAVICWLGYSYRECLGGKVGKSPEVHDEVMLRPPSDPELEALFEDLVPRATVY